MFLIGAVGAGSCRWNEKLRRMGMPEVVDGLRLVAMGGCMKSIEENNEAIGTMFSFCIPGPVVFTTCADVVGSRRGRERTTGPVE